MLYADYPFKEYIDDNEHNFFYAGKKIYRNVGDEGYYIANSYPEIRELEVNERLPKELIYSAKFSIKGIKGTLYECEFAFSIKSKKVTFIDNLFWEYIRETVIINDERSYKALCRRYIQHVLINETSRFNDYAVKIGWRGTGDYIDFIPITDDGGWRDNPLQEKVFNGFYQNYNGEIHIYPINRTSELTQYTDKTSILKHTNSCKLLFDCLCKSQELMCIFLYTIHSLLWEFCKCEINDGNPLPDIPFGDGIFSIAIIGNNMKFVKQIANIFSNIFYVDLLHAPYLQTASYISTSSLKVNFLELKEMHGIPLIVTIGNC